MSTVAWSTDFFTAVSPIAYHWTTTYRVTQDELIEQGQITYKDIANAFCKEISLMHSRLKGRSPNIAKGAFGPSYTRQDNPDQDASRDAQNSVEGTSRRLRKRPVKRTRALDEDNSPSTVTRLYKVCGLHHPLANCFYVFLKKAL